MERQRQPAADYRRSNRAALRLAAWTLAWLASFAVARFGPASWWDPQEHAAASWTAVAANALIGAGWILAFTRFLGHSTSCSARSCSTRSR
ncbi:hypothetical protein ACQ3I4_02705 [Zafaria sp. Z1313]|uniref:hypothetical protein n=1 Tax=unclassified Zafaria TaxID=2828765 RepID=UPI002E7921CA|nr:hypothetical protein [Zafaria sp. J156]MEE1621187.1 hypothetical protein [Zafaria sp. J156]